MRQRTKNVTLHQTLRCDHREALETKPSSKLLHIFLSLSPPHTHTHTKQSDTHTLRRRHTHPNAASSPWSGHLSWAALYLRTWAVCETRSRSLGVTECQRAADSAARAHPPLFVHVSPSLSVSRLRFPSALINPSLSQKARKNAASQQPEMASRALQPHDNLSVTIL